MQRWTPIFLFLALLMAGCVPGAISPALVYDDAEGMSTGPYPASTRAGDPDRDGFYVSMGPSGLGLEVACGPAGRCGGYTGAAGRVSWSQDAVGT
ncbi:hypothetical protein [Oceanithermus sp.]